MTKPIIRIDKGDGKRSRETQSRVKDLIAREYPKEMRGKVFADLMAGEREFCTKFAVYQIKGFMSHAKRYAEALNK